MHTPASLYQKYGTEDGTTWEAFLKDLESLLGEFAVLDINDYLFIDGFKRLITKQQKMGD